MYVSTQTNVGDFLDDLGEDLTIKIVHDRFDETPYYLQWNDKEVWLTNNDMEGLKKVIIRALKVRKVAIS